MIALVTGLPVVAPRDTATFAGAFGAQLRGAVRKGGLMIALVTGLPVLAPRDTPAFADAFGARARERAAAFGVQQMVRSYAAPFEKVVA